MNASRSVTPIKRAFVRHAFVFLMIMLAGYFTPLLAQQTLFDDSRVSSVYVTLPADSLEWIYQNVLSDHYVMATFVYDDGNGRDTLENAGFRLRGNTSRYSQKKSFKISFNTYVSGRTYQNVKKINLNGEHNDPTMVREKLFYELWNKAGMVERRTSFVRVYINGSYFGLYTNLEELDKSWLKRVYPDNDGNLYKCTWPADMVYLGPGQQVYKDLQSGAATGGRAYELQTNEEEDDYSGLVNLITAFDQEPDTAFANNIEVLFNVKVFLKALALDVATGNWDNYSFNRNNYYLYDEPDAERFEYFTYDPDNSFGVDWLQVDWAERNCLEWVNEELELPMAQKLLAVPEFFTLYKNYLDTIARTLIEPDSVYPRIDEMKNLIAQAAIEDTYRCLDYGYTVDDFFDGFEMAIDGHTPYGIKPFLAKRAENILKQLIPPGIGDPEKVNPLALLFPNPASAWVNLTFSEEEKSGEIYEVMIQDASGRILKAFRKDPSAGLRIRLDLNGLESGLYLVRIRKGAEVCHLKLLKN